MSLDAKRVLDLGDDADDNTFPTPEPGFELVGEDTNEAVLRVLDLTRRQLELDVVLVGEFALDGEVCRYVVGRASDFRIRPGDVVPSSTEVIRIGDLAVPRSPATDVLLDMPIRLSDGRLFGSLRAMGRAEAPLNHRDISFMRVVAELIGHRLEFERARENATAAARSRILKILDGRHDLLVVFQPIVDLRTGRVAGCEALTRFMYPPRRTPDQWFAEAWAVDLGMELELAAVCRALEHASSLPEDCYVSINVSPAVAASYQLDDVISNGIAERMVLELTEHTRVEDYHGLGEAMRRLRRRGVKLAIDDTGAGFASLRHVLRLSPEIIKLDVSLTQGLDSDPRRWALAESLLMFSHNIGAPVVAEGIETSSDLATLKLIGFPYGQGRALWQPSAPPLPVRIELE